MSKVIPARKFDVNLINIPTPIPLPIPEKTKKRYTSFLTYGEQESPVYVQLNSLDVKNKDAGDLTLKFDDGTRVLFANLENRCIDEIFLRSEEFFKGRVFPREKIESSFTHVSTDVGDSSPEFLKVNVNWDTVKIRDQNSILRTVNDNFTSAIALIHLESIIYRPDSIALQFSAKQLQVFVPVSDLETWAIQDDTDTESDEEEETFDDTLYKERHNFEKLTLGETDDENEIEKKDVKESDLKESEPKKRVVRKNGKKDTFF